MNDIVMTFDVGGMGIKVAIFSGLNMKEKDMLQYSSKIKGAKIELSEIINLILEFIKFKNIKCRVGIALPGIIDVDKTEILSKTTIINYTGKNIKNLLLKNNLIKNVLVENDAKAALYGEFKFTDSEKDCFLITIGTAIGGAGILNKKIVRGKKGFAGEISKISYNFDSIASIGKRMSTLFLINDYAKKINQTSHELNGKKILSLCEQNNDLAIKSLKKMCKRLANLILLINCVGGFEKILVGGGISESDFFINFLIESVFKIYKAKYISEFIPIVEKCSLGNYAACYGMLYLMRDDINEKMRDSL